MTKLEEKNREVTSSKMGTKKLVALGLLAAISIVLVTVVRIPFPSAPFLEYDPADIPIIIGTMVYGPVAGLMLTFVLSAIQALTVSSGSGIIGFLMHFVATGSMVVVTGNIYKHARKSLPWIVLSLALGSLTMVVVMVGMNYIFMPIFGIDPSLVAGMLVTAVIPFNTVKAVVNAASAFALSKTLEKTGVLNSLHS